MPSPDRTAGGEPDDWGSKKSCPPILGLMLIIGGVSVAQYVTLIGHFVNSL